MPSTFGNGHSDGAAQVLVVDDELGIRETFQEVLEEEGYDVATAADFFEAEALLAERSFDVVVTDIVMPRVNGLELLRRVREIDEDIPVIMITGEPDVSTAARAVRHGAYDYVAKPITLDALLHVVGRAAEKKRLLDEKHRLERENLAYQSNLERKVVERTVELERRNRELAALIGIGRDISATLDLTMVLERVTQRAAQVCEANRCTILLLEEGGKVAIPLMSRFDDERRDPKMWRLFKNASYPIPVDQVPEAQRVVRERQPLFIPDVSASSLPEHLVEPFSVASVLLVPLTSKERVIGLMALDQVEKGREFTPAQADLAVAIAAQAAIAIENARLFEGEMSSRRLADTLRQVAQALSSTLSLDDVLGLILTELEHVIPLDSGSIMLLEGQALIIRAARGFADPASVLEVCLDLETAPLNREVVESKRPLIVGHVHEDERWLEAMQISGLKTELGDICSWMGVPLIVKGRVIGILTTDKREAHFYSARDAQVALTFANQAAIAIENARLFEAEQRRTDELTSLHEAAVAVSSSLEPSEVLRALAEQAGRALDASSAYICDWDEESAQSTVLAEWISPDASTGLSELGSVYDMRRYPNTLRALQEKRHLAAQAADPDLDPGDRDLAERYGWKSYLIVPLVMRSQVIGYVELWESRRERGFTPAEVRLCQTLAADAAVALENARLYDAAQQEIVERKRAEKELRERAARLELVARVGQSTTAILELDELLDQAANLIGDTFEYYNVNVFLVEGDAVVLRASTFPPYRPSEKIVRLRVGEEGITGWVAANGEPLLVPDVSVEPRYRVTLEGIETQSELAVPIELKGIVIGVLDVQSARLDAFSQADLFTLQTIARQLAVAIENARLFAEITRRLNELSLLYEVTLATAATLDLDEILRRTVEAVHGKLQLDVFGFLLVDEEAGVARLHPTFLGVPDEIADFSTPLGEGITGWVAQTGRPLLAPDVSQEPRYLDGVSGMRSEVCVPLKIGDKVIGVIDAESTRLNAFSEDDVRLFSTLASQLSLVLDNARLFDETRRRLAEARLVQEVMLAAASTLDFDLVLERTVKALNRALGIQRLGFLLPDERNGVLATHPSLVGFAEAAFQMPIEGSLAGRAYRTGQPVLVRDLAQWPAYAGRASDVQSVLVVPVRVADRIIAVLHAESDRAGAFDEDDLLLFVTIAGQLGVALHNARLYSQLQELDRLRTELVQNVGHELRTPLGIIKGYVELLRDGDLGPILDEQKSALQIVRERTIALSRLIHNLTVLQALPREALALFPVSLVEVTRHALEEFRGPAARVGIELVEELPGELPTVMGDRERLSLALGHLLDNAIKFSPDGGTVTVRAWDEQGTVCVSIADQGVGISPDNLDRIFERFYQVNGSATRRFGGMGVGLALVWEIVEAHGGTVSLDSAVGEGSVFTVVLPQMIASMIASENS